MAVLAATGAEPAAAHGAGSGPVTTVDPALARSGVLAVAALTAMVSWARRGRPSRGVAPAVEDAGDDELWPLVRDDEERQGVAGLARRAAIWGPRLTFLALVALALIAWAGPDADPFGTVPRLVLLGWIGSWLVSVVLGPAWSVMTPAAASLWRPRRSWPPRAMPSLVEVGAPGLGLAAFLWFQLAFHAGAQQRWIAVMLACYLVGIVMARRRWSRVQVRRIDPIAATARVLGSMSPLARRPATGTGSADGTGSPSRAGIDRLPVQGAVVAWVLCGAAVFQLLQHRPAWSELVGMRQGWSLTAMLSLGLAGSLAAVALVLVLSVAFVRLVAGSAHHAAEASWVRAWVSMAATLVPLAAAVSVGHQLGPFVTAVQDQLFTLWDPFGRGWDPFGTGRQGVQVSLIGTWVDDAQVALLLLATGWSVSATVRAFRAPLVVFPALFMTAALAIEAAALVVG